jgi:hypothetical protein
MKSSIKKYNYSLRIALLLSYLLMTGVISFHYHEIDFKVNPTVAFNAADKNNDSLISSPHKGCEFIHQAANQFQYYENIILPEPVLIFSAVLIIQIDQTVFKKCPHLSFLRAPPSFS